MQSKLSTLTEHMAAGRYRKAISLAAGWHELGQHKAEITRARSALTSPAMYRDMGHDPAALVAQGIVALRVRYDLPGPRTVAAVLPDAQQLLPT